MFNYPPRRLTARPAKTAFKPSLRTESRSAPEPHCRCRTALPRSPHSTATLSAVTPPARPHSAGTRAPATEMAPGDDPQDDEGQLTSALLAAAEKLILDSPTIGSKTLATALCKQGFTTVDNRQAKDLLAVPHCALPTVPCAHCGLCPLSPLPAAHRRYPYCPVPAHATSPHTPAHHPLTSALSTVRAPGLATSAP